MSKAARKATTFRIDSIINSRLEKLSKLLGKSLNKLANEALEEFVNRRTLEVEHDLEETLKDLRAYRKSDPNFEHAIADFVEAEATVKLDPAEGRIVSQLGQTQLSQGLAGTR